MFINTLYNEFLLYGPIALGALIGGFVFGFIYRWILRKVFPKTTRGIKKNIVSHGRILRAVSGGILLIGAILASRSSVLFFWAGFCFFEAIFSRCGFYAAIGRNDCPLK